MKDSGVRNPINFDDVGVPGYKGERAEKIVYKNDTQILINLLLLPIMPLDIEGVYKKLSGYYDNLKKKRMLDKQYVAIVGIMEFYGLVFFINNYNLEEDEVYEFVLGALENTNIEENFKTSDHGLVLKSFEEYYKSISVEKISLIIVLFFLVAFIPHKYYVSTSLYEFKEDRGSLQITIKVFQDDFINAIKKIMVLIYK